MPRILAALLLTLPFASWAGDDHDDDHRHYRKHEHRYHAHKQEFWDGQCKVKREWKKNGEYKEKRKCKDRPVVYQQPYPVYVAPLPPQGVVIQSQIHLRP
ncbi:hypothetical protein N5C12_10140 [Comamonas aquatica]|uniref:hypothetical protein n=1 Tax=Comamonas aquatica TaxID=225991 RepID=UPI00244D5DE4|nr:hypothetical protein [Comamonas aquatica]MDH0899711.1 hypothetical protein [Comamonas aquatica]